MRVERDNAVDSEAKFRKERDEAVGVLDGVKQARDQAQARGDQLRQELKQSAAMMAATEQALEAAADAHKEASELDSKALGEASSRQKVLEEDQATFILVQLSLEEEIRNRKEAQ